MRYAKHKLCVPEIEWLGVRYSDLQRYGVPQEALLPLTRNDRRMANRLLKAQTLQHVHHEVEQDLRNILNCGYKAEIECMSCGFSHGLVRYVMQKLADCASVKNDSPQEEEIEAGSPSDSDATCSNVSDDDDKDDVAAAADDDDDDDDDICVDREPTHRPSHYHGIDNATSNGYDCASSDTDDSFSSCHEDTE